MQDLESKLVGVLGYGQEGKAIASYLVKHGINPVLFDQRPWENWGQTEKTAIKKSGLNFIFGPDAFKELTGFDAVFRSPGIKIANITTAVKGRLPIVTSQTKWFFEHCPAKIIGVTGTKGKGTTASLTSEILEKNFQHPISRARSRVYLTGNIGETQPLEILDGLTENDWVVYELSSFQLQDLDRSPYIAVVLMVTSEHLDYHEDENEYVEAKSAITKYQTKKNFAVINADFGNSTKIGGYGEGKKLYFSRKRTDVDCFTDAANLIGPGIQYPISDIQLRGSHNLENIMAATLAAQCAGAAPEVIGTTAINFKGLEHRLEFVSEADGVRYYNDSFSTTPETAIAAMRSFTEPTIVILGGSGKNSDFTELGKTVTNMKNIKAVILIGEEGPRIKTAIARAGKFAGRLLEGARSMADIFAQIKPIAASGDIVLLSPGCASFGMFKNYKDRGQQFKNCAKNLSIC